VSDEAWEDIGKLQAELLELKRRFGALAAEQRTLREMVISLGSRVKLIEGGRVWRMETVEEYAVAPDRTKSILKGERK
jgi:hypothetical protein